MTPPVPAKVRTACVDNTLEVKAIFPETPGFPAAAATAATGPIL